MRKLTLALTIFLISCATNSSWTGDDKRKHAIAGVSIGAGSVTALNMVNYQGDRKLAASALVVAAGVGKELYDQYDYGGFDYKDLIMTVVPGVASVYMWDAALNYSVTKQGDATMINYNKEF